MLAEYHDPRYQIGTVSVKEKLLGRVEIRKTESRKQKLENGRSRTKSIKTKRLARGSPALARIKSARMGHAKAFSEFR